MITNALLFLINVGFGFFVYALLLRFWMQAMRAPFRNPAGQAVIAITDFMVKPARRLIPGLFGHDLPTLVLAWLLQWLWLIAEYAVQSLNLAVSPLSSGGLVWVLALLAVVQLLKISLYLLIAAMLVQAVLSWVAPYHPLGHLLNALTGPFLTPIRRLIPPLGGTLDLSPLLAFVVINLILIVPIPWLESVIIRLAQ